MKKIFLLVLIFIYLKSFGQYPNGVQTLGNDSNVITPKGAFRGRVINHAFTDTAAANVHRIRDYPGAQIYTTSDDKFRIRNAATTAWIEIGSSGSGTVSNFSAGDLSPLFTTSVATSTTTPALTFNLSNAGAYTIFGRGATVGGPSFLTSIDSNWIPHLHTEAYYIGKFGNPFNQVAVDTSTGHAIMTLTRVNGSFEIRDFGRLASAYGFGSGGANSLGTYIVQTATNAPANAQILASLATGIVKNTTTTGALSIATAGTDYLTPTGSAAGLTSFPTFNQNTTGSAATLTTPRNIQGVAFNGSANIDIINGTGFVKTTGTTLSYDNSTYVPTSRLINTTSPLTGGGDLSADRTIAINNAAADGSTKGAASFTAADFDATSGNINIDYTNGQAASGSTKGFLPSADWTTFNNKFTLPSLTTGSVLFSNGTTIAQDNASLFFDDTNNRLGYLTTAPTHTETHGSTSTGIALYNTSDQTTNYERGRISWASNVFRFDTEAAGSGTARDAVINAGTREFRIFGGGGSSGIYRFAGSTSLAGAMGVTLTGNSWTASSGVNSMIGIIPTINQTSTAGYRMLWISPLISGSGSGVANLIDAGTNSSAAGAGTHTSVFSVTNTGAVATSGNITVGGVVVPTISSTNTLTNKRITARYGSTTSSATPTINTDNVDVYELTAQAVDITSFTTNLSGTPNIDDVLHIIITGTAARAITWGAGFESSTVALPSTTVGTDRLDVYLIRTAASIWRCAGVH